MKIVIVGASGFIGQHLGAHLGRQGLDVLGLDIRCDSAAVSRFPIQCCDCSSDEIVFDPPVDAVFYLAQARCYRQHDADLSALFSVNVQGAVRTMEAAVRSGARSFLYASTGNVYAPSFTPLSEDMQIAGYTPYAASKLAAERSLQLWGDRINLINARLFGVFGPHQQTMLVPKLMRRVISGQPVSVAPRADGAADQGGLRISMTYVHDLVRWLSELCELTVAAPRHEPRTLNIASGEAVSIRQIAEAIGNLLSIAPRFEPGQTPRPGDLVANVEDLRSLIDLKATRFEDALRLTVDAAAPLESTP